jgi:hypothetical protein
MNILKNPTKVCPLARQNFVFFGFLSIFDYYLRILHPIFSTDMPDKQVYNLPFNSGVGSL